MLGFKSTEAGFHWKEQSFGRDPHSCREQQAILFGSSSLYLLSGRASRTPKWAAFTLRPETPALPNSLRSLTPAVNSDAAVPAQPPPSPEDVPLPVRVHVAAGASSTCALDSTGQVLCWGDNSHGQLGIGNSSFSASPYLYAVLDSTLESTPSSAARSPTAR